MYSLDNFFQQILTVSSRDPDDERRRRNLNILLLGLGPMLLIIVVLVIYRFTFSGVDTEGNFLILWGSVFMFVGTIIVYLINRYLSGVIAASLFLLLLIAAISFSDTPAQISNGRSLFVFVIPVAMASLVLRPGTTFYVAAISSGIIISFALSLGSFPNTPAILGYFLVAFISWLSSRSLEQALRELRVINAELDQRVVERTSELSESLAREAAQASQREAILNSIADGVVVFDNHGSAIVANPSITAMTGKPQEAIIGHGISNLLSSSEIEADQHARISNIFAREGAVPTFRVNWGKKTLSVNAAEVRDVNNQSIGTVAVFRDVTREAELERMKDTFVAVVSHELRTPLNAILGFAEMIKETVYGPVSESQKKVSVRIMENTRRLLSIVSELLDQAQIQSGRMKINSEPCNPSELLKSVQDTMEHISSEKGVNLVTEIDSRMPQTLIGDSQRLQQIMINLTNNAIKFTPKGGEVRVSINKAGDKTWQIQVKDTGEGIPEEAREYIFDTFRQVESSATRNYGGVGLGLAIVKQLVELMNGRINVDSQTNAGSVFTVTLPLITN